MTYAGEVHKQVWRALLVTAFAANIALFPYGPRADVMKAREAGEKLRECISGEKSKIETVSRNMFVDSVPRSPKDLTVLTLNRACAGGGDFRFLGAEVPMFEAARTVDIAFRSNEQCDELTDWQASLYGRAVALDRSIPPRTELTLDAEKVTTCSAEEDLQKMYREYCHTDRQLQQKKDAAKKAREAYQRAIGAFETEKNEHRSNARNPSIAKARNLRHQRQKELNERLAEETELDRKLSEQKNKMKELVNGEPRPSASADRCVIIQGEAADGTITRVPTRSFSGARGNCPCGQPLKDILTDPDLGKQIGEKSVHEAITLLEAETKRSFELYDKLNVRFDALYSFVLPSILLALASTIGVICWAVAYRLHVRPPTLVKIEAESYPWLDARRLDNFLRAITFSAAVLEPLVLCNHWFTLVPDRLKNVQLPTMTGPVSFTYLSWANAVVVVLALISAYAAWRRYHRLVEEQRTSARNDLRDVAGHIL